MITTRELVNPYSIGVRTLQCYDQIGLLELSGYQGRIRIYGEAAKRKLRCIFAWRVLDLSLEETTEFQQRIMDQEQLSILLEQKKKQFMMLRDVLPKNQMRVDDVLSYIQQSRGWSPGDYTEILSL